MEKNCENCEFEMVRSSDEPCVDCSRHPSVTDNWAAVK